MTEIPTSLRLPEELVARADALVEKLKNDPELAAHGRVTRAVVMRLALLRGLDALEKKGVKR